MLIFISLQQYSSVTLLVKQTILFIGVRAGGGYFF